MNALLQRLGTFAARKHWWVIGVWLVVLVSLSVLRGAIGGNFVNNYNVPGSQSSAGLTVLRTQFHSASGYSGQIVFHARKGTVADQSSAVGTAMKNIGNLPHVVSATDPLTQQGTPAVSKDGSIAYGNVSWSVVTATLDQSYLDSMNRAVAPARHAGLQVEYGGGAGQIGQQTNDLPSELLGLTCALLLLLIMFGSLAAAGTPLLSAIFSVGSGLAIVGIVAGGIQLPTTAPTVATLLGLGVAIDYGLFLVARHREQLDHGMPVEESIGRTAATSGAAIVVAGSTVVVAILGLYVSAVPFVGALGLSSAIVVAVTIAAALTLVPALLALARTRVRSRADRRAAKAHTAPPDHEHSAFARWGRMVSSHPWPWGVASVVLLVFLAIPLLSLRLGQLDNGTNPKSDSSRRAYDLVTQGFGVGQNGPLTVVLKMPKGANTQSVVQDATTKLTAAHDVASVSPANVNSAGTVAVLNVIPKTNPQAEATTNLVTDVRDTVLPGIHAKGYVVGTVAGYYDFTNKVASRMIWLILAVVLLSMVLLGIAFRSVVIPLKAAVLNLLSVGAAYGVVIAVFQFGWGSSLIGIDQHLPIPAFVPMMMFAIVFGLSMDYEVFLLSRVHEAWLHLGDAHRAVAVGIGSTARVITTAASIMVVVFTSFVLNSDPTVKMLAIGMAAAVLIDASVVRMVLVPSVMSILGARAWYMPRWLQRVVPNLELEGPLEEPAAEAPAVEPAPEPAPEPTPAAPAAAAKPAEPAEQVSVPEQRGEPTEEQQEEQERKTPARGRHAK
ncbi:MAG: MMPL family transporter [Nocardioidaceae bacterium]